MKLGLIVNILIRLSILYFLGEVLFLPDDPRFAGKAIPIRNFIIVITLSLLSPFFYFIRKKWSKWFDFAHHKYPYWWDNLYLSIFWLDMAGNSLNLYDSFFYFDLIPHFHGTGAIAAVLLGAFGWTFWSGLGFANIIHMLLETQEYYTDVLLKTHNVRGTFDVINDLAVGLVGALIYGLIYFSIVRWYKK